MGNALLDIEVPKLVHDVRLQICGICPLLLGDKRAIHTARCGGCGCFVYVKSGLKDFTCPKGKW